MIREAKAEPSFSLAKSSGLASLPAPDRATNPFFLDKSAVFGYNRGMDRGVLPSP